VTKCHTPPQTRVAHCALLASTPTHLVVTERPVLGTQVGDAPLYARCWDLLHRDKMRACDSRHAHACSRPGRHTGETVSLVRVQRCSCFLQRSRDRGEPHFVTSGYASLVGTLWGLGVGTALCKAAGSVAPSCPPLGLSQEAHFGPRATWRANRMQMQIRPNERSPQSRGGCGGRS
jgi:hypothetical protein